MKYILITKTFLIVILNFFCLYQYIPTTIRFNGDSFEKTTKNLKASLNESEDIHKITKQIMLDYPDLPEKVKIVLEEFPGLVAGKNYSLLRLSEVHKSLVTLIAFNSSFFVIWALLVTFYYYKNERCRPKAGETRVSPEWR